MLDDLAFDWVALASLGEVEQVVEQVRQAHGLSVEWLSSTPDVIPMRSGFMTMPPERPVATLTLQAFWPDQTHVRLLPSQGGQDALAAFTSLADTLYGALRSRGWMPIKGPLHGETPRFLRPQGFRPRPSKVKDP